MQLIALIVTIPLLIWALLFCRYDLKKGQLKMADDEKSSSEVAFVCRDIFKHVIKL